MGAYQGNKNIAKGGACQVKRKMPLMSAKSEIIVQATHKFLHVHVCV